MTGPHPVAAAVPGAESANEALLRGPAKRRPMAIERETAIEVAVSAVAVGAFIAAVVYVGINSSDGGLGGQAALALVGLIVAFIAAMTAAGYWLSGRDV